MTEDTTEELQLSTNQANPQAMATWTQMKSPHLKRHGHMVLVMFSSLHTLVTPSTSSHTWTLAHDPFTNQLPPQLSVQTTSIQILQTPPMSTTNTCELISD